MRATFSIYLLAVVVILCVETPVSSSPYFPHGFEENPNARSVDAGDELNYRLPNETYPEHYDIKLTTNVHTGDNSFQGEVIIDIVVAEETNSIVIHARQLNISHVTIADATGVTVEELSATYELEREFLTLTRKNNQRFAADTKWKLTITYDGKLRDDKGGFYLSSYLDNSGKTRYLATTQFGSTDARHAFPCYDEPDKRAKFTITINHSPTYTAISNMPINENFSSAGRTVFRQTNRIPTYIMAFIVSDFPYSEGVLNGLPQRIYSRPSAKENHEWALVSAMLITARLSEYYGVDFMMPKMDHVAVPDFHFGAMENFGLITYREENLLYNKTSSTVFTQTSIANMVAHEICHQWFGNYVSIKWWTYFWLKEGFATLFSYKALDDTYPEWGVWQQFFVNVYQRAFTADSEISPRPMTHYVQKPAEIVKLVDNISYNKAGSVLNMWRHALTDKVFQRGLHNYLINNQYSAVVEEDLFTAIQIAAKEENFAIPSPISVMLGSWTRQGGYPLLTVTRHYTNGTFTVKQETYCHNGTSTDTKLWFVPFNYVVASQPDFRNTRASHYLLDVIKSRVDDVNISAKDWLILNKQSTGYYRIKYDADNYKLIIKSLIENPFAIHPHNRAQLMDDAFKFSQSSSLDHAVLLSMMTYLAKENQYAPWNTAVNIFSTFHRYLMLDNKYNHLQRFIHYQIIDVYKKLGVNEGAGEQHYEKYIRHMIVNLACLIGNKDCLDAVRQKLVDLVYSKTAIEPNLRSVVYCNGLKQSSDEQFHFFYKELMDSTDQAYRQQLVSALGCSQNKSHVDELIYSSIDETNKLRTEERYNVLISVYSRGEVGLLACIEFLKEKWHEYGSLKTNIGDSNPLDTDIRIMASYVISKNHEKQLLSLVDKVKNSEHVTSTLETDVKKTMADNFDWLQINRDPIMKWVEEYKPNAGSIRAAASSMLLLAAIVVSIIHVL